MNRRMKCLLIMLLILLNPILFYTKTYAQSSVSNLSPPLKIKATYDDSEYKGSILIRWKRVKEAKYYQVFRSSNSINGKYIKISGNIKYTTFMDTELETEKEYYYRILCGNDEIKSILSSPVVGRAVSQDIPEIPENIKATYNKYYDKIFIKWNSVTDAMRYAVYRSTDNKTYKLISNKLKHNYYIDYDIDFDKNYYYKVKSINNSGSSDISEYVVGRKKTPFNLSSEGRTYYAVINLLSPLYLTIHGLPIPYTGLGSIMQGDSVNSFISAFLNIGSITSLFIGYKYDNLNMVYIGTGLSIGSILYSVIAPFIFFIPKRNLTIYSIENNLPIISASYDPFENLIRIKLIYRF